VIQRLDHLVLTTRYLERCVDFYTRVLGMRLETFGDGRLSFRFGDQKINLHEAGREFEPKAERPTPGALDLCFLALEPLDVVIRRLETAGVPIELGPVPRTGATGPISFDDKGDRKDAEITIFTMKGGKIEPIAVVKAGKTLPYEEFVKTMGAAK